MRSFALIAAISLVIIACRPKDRYRAYKYRCNTESLRLLIENDPFLGGWFLFDLNAGENSKMSEHLDKAGAFEAARKIFKHPEGCFQEEFKDYYL